MLSVTADARENPSEFGDREKGKSGYLRVVTQAIGARTDIGYRHCGAQSAAGFLREGMRGDADQKEQRDESA